MPGRTSVVHSEECSRCKGRRALYHLTQRPVFMNLKYTTSPSTISSTKMIKPVISLFVTLLRRAQRQQQQARATSVSSLLQTHLCAIPFSVDRILESDSCVSAIWTRCARARLSTKKVERARAPCRVSAPSTPGASSALSGRVGLCVGAMPMRCSLRRTGAGDARTGLR